MKTGMLWFDDHTSQTLCEKIERAATRYTEKYGQRPNTCYVHPIRLLGNPELPADITVVASDTVLPRHLWIGIK